MKKTTGVLSSIAIGIMIGIIIFECILAIKIYNSRRSGNIIVEIEEGETSVVEFEKLGLVPGQSVEYKLSLSTKDGPTNGIYLNFSETEDSPLKDFVKAKITINDVVICDDLLVDLFDESNILYEIDIYNSDCDIVIVYYMPAEVGNEAENAEAWFDLLITAEFQ